MSGFLPRFGKGNCGRCGSPVPDVSHLRHKNLCRSCYNNQCRSYYEESDRSSWIIVTGPKNSRRVIQHLIHVGIVEPLPCQVCKSNISVAHHVDYNVPLLILWLCYKHHIAVHHGERFNISPVDYSKDVLVYEFISHRKNNKLFKDINIIR